MTICEGAVAVIPAAGHGSRLGLTVPKILAPLGRGCTVWDALHAALRPHVEHIHVVLSPAGHPQFEARLATSADGECVSTGLQTYPTGMGDAVFSAQDVFAQYRQVLVVWGDQALVSERTVGHVVRAQSSARQRSLNNLDQFILRDRPVCHEDRMPSSGPTPGHFHFLPRQCSGQRPE